MDDIQRQKTEWRRKGWSIPDLRGGKQIWFSLVVELVQLVQNNQSNDLDSIPQLQNAPTSYSWRTYTPFLKGIGLISNRAGVLSLTDVGVGFCNESTKRYLADLIQDRFRLFGEILKMLEESPKTIEEVDRQICKSFCLDWANHSNTRKRMDWLDVLDLIQEIGNRKWALTDEGKAALSDWIIVTPEVVESLSSEPNNITVSAPPEEIGILLQRLAESPEMHRKRNTYNIWVPSPNRIENLRVITQFAFEKVSKKDLFKFIEDEFNLKTSSVDSMLPFLKASGLIEEVGRSIYIASPAAKAWCETGNDLDFIRILHSNMRFVGEMVKAASNDIIRNDIYAQAKTYGLNNEKARWIAGFLLEAGLLEEPQYLHLKATPLGKSFISDLPLDHLRLEDASKINDHVNDTDNSISVIDMSEQIFSRLRIASRDPMAEGKPSGVAFEEAIADIFCFMGFDAKRIGGAGDTDVIVRWRDDEGKNVVAIVDGKSKSGGAASHNDISDVAIDTHKDKNNADFVAIIAPGFSGDTIRNHARKKEFALITDIELIEIARNSHTLGMCLQEIATIFQVPDGLSKLDELIAAKQREMDIITLVVSMFGKEQEMLGGLSPRDMYLLSRTSDISPSLEELLAVFETLSGQEVSVLFPIKKDSSPENIAYLINGEKRSVNRLRALASAIENGLG